MPRVIAWRSLIPGLVVLGALLALATVILFRARLGGLSGPTFRLYVVAPGANGVTAGSDVWLAGQRVGVVKQIVFRSPAVPVDARLVIQLDVIDRARSVIRSDSRVQLRNGGTAIGVPVVYLGFGTASAPPIHSGDTLRIAAPPDVGAVVDRAGDAIHGFPDIMTNLHRAAAEAAASESAVTSIIKQIPSSDAGPSSQPSLLTQGGLTSRMAQVAHLDTAILSDAHTGAAAADSIQARAGSRGQSLEQLVHGSTLTTAAQHLSADRAVVQSMAHQNDGALARAETDTGVHSGVTGALAELRALIADMKAHPFRYVAPF